jgi:hypothetical protein
MLLQPVFGGPEHQASGLTIPLRRRREKGDESVLLLIGCEVVTPISETVFFLFCHPEFPFR